MIDRKSELPIVRQCDALGLCRSALYYQPRPQSAADLRLMRALDELHLAHPFLGARKLAHLLKREGFAVGRRHVGTLMQLMGIEPLYRKRRTSLPQKGHKIYPYLLGASEIERPNQVWAADISVLQQHRRRLQMS
jgi:putative transposase